MDEPCREPASIEALYRGKFLAAVSVYPLDGRGQLWPRIRSATRGKGLPEQDLTRIFAPFFTTAKRSGGTGLGLSIVQAIVTAHHGTIALAENDSGARFRILLPVNVD